MAGQAGLTRYRASVFPEERLKELVSNRTYAWGRTIKPLRSESISIEARLNQMKDLSQFHPSGAETPTGRNPEGEKRSCKSCRMFSAPCSLLNSMTQYSSFQLSVISGQQKLGSSAGKSPAGALYEI